MVNMASPAARRALGRVKDMGQKSRTNTEFHRSTCAAMAAAGALRLKRVTSQPAPKKRMTAMVPMER